MEKFEGRHEYKYVITPELAEIIKKETADKLLPDKYGNPPGHYEISSLYFDNDKLDLYHQTYNREPYRVKLRLRVYDKEPTGDSVSFFETKAKLCGSSDKKRSFARLDDNLALYRGELPPKTPHQVDIVNLIKKYGLKPMAVVSYDRDAFYDPKKPRLRITFDYHLRLRTDDLDLKHGNYGVAVMPDNLMVLEVKNDENIPYWMVKLLSKYKLTNQSYSKYGQLFRLFDGSSPYMKLGPLPTPQLVTVKDGEIAVTPQTSRTTVFK